MLRVRNLGRGALVAPASFDLRAGQILGIAGLIGSGRTELLRLIFGADHADQGEVFIGDQTKAANISSSKNALASGIAMITEDRKSQGLLFPQSIGVNVTLANLSSVSKFGMLDQPAEIAVVDDYIKRLRIRSPAGCIAIARSCYSTNRPAASTSVPSSISTNCSPTWRGKARAC